jgi:hypothetical protein
MANPRLASGPQAQPASVPVAGCSCPVMVTLIYGVEEFGAILPCSRCVHAERIVQKVAERHPDEVCVAKLDVGAEEVSRYGVVFPPTILVNDEVLASGQGVSEQKLEKAIEEHLSRRD